MFSSQTGNVLSALKNSHDSLILMARVAQNIEDNNLKSSVGIHGNTDLNKIIIELKENAKALEKVLSTIYEVDKLIQKTLG